MRGPALARYLMLAAAFLFAGCSHLSSQPPSTKAPGMAGESSVAVRQAIEEANAALVQALRSRDAAAVAAWFVPEASLRAEGKEPVRGREAIHALYAQVLTTLEVRDVVRTTWEVRVEEDMAVELGTSILVLAQPESPYVHAILPTRYMIVWQRQADGSWRIWAVREAPTELPLTDLCCSVPT